MKIRLHEASDQRCGRTIIDCEARHLGVVSSLESSTELSRFASLVQLDHPIHILPLSAAHSMALVGEVGPPRTLHGSEPSLTRRLIAIIACNFLFSLRSRYRSATPWWCQHDDPLHIVLASRPLSNIIWDYLQHHHFQH